MPAPDGCAQSLSQPRRSTDTNTCTVRISTESRACVVHVSGELDLAARELVYRACLSAGDGAVVVDLAQLHFMDCAGYGGLVAAGANLRANGGSLSLRRRTGQPAHLLAALGRIEAQTTTVRPDAQTVTSGSGSAPILLSSNDQPG